MGVFAVCDKLTFGDKVIKHQVHTPNGKVFIGDSIKKFNKPLGYVLSGLDNGSWMFGKLRKGYTIIDIGITTTHRGFGYYYGIERFMIAQWKYRNVWKLPLNLLL